MFDHFTIFEEIMISERVQIPLTRVHFQVGESSLIIFALFYLALKWPLNDLVFQFQVVLTFPEVGGQRKIILRIVAVVELVTKLLWRHPFVRIYPHCLRLVGLDKLKITSFLSENRAIFVRLQLRHEPVSLTELG